MKFHCHILIAASILLCACEKSEKGNPSLVRIIDARIDTAEDITAYLEAASLTGAVEVAINGHTWRFHTPFHSKMNVQLDAPASHSFEISESTTEKEITEWLEGNRTNWIRYTPSNHSDVRFLWWTIDAMEEKGMAYGLLKPLDNREIVGLLEALVPSKKGSQPGGGINSVRSAHSVDTP